MSRSRVFLSLLCAVGLINGCRESMPEMASVSGTVLVKGKPRAKLLVRFMCDGFKGNNSPITAFGETDAQGKYSLKYAFKNANGEGAPIGWHRVVIEDTTLSSLAQGQSAPPRIIPLAYTAPSTTPLSVEVKTGPQTIDLEIK